MQDNYKEVDLEKERMKAAFRYIDKDNDGFLTLRELKTILCHNNSGISDEEIEQFFKEIDTDGDGKIDYEGAYLLSKCDQRKIDYKRYKFTVSS